MDQKEFNELHSSCVSAFRNYAAEADITANMLADCTAEPAHAIARSIANRAPGENREYGTRGLSKCKGSSA
jgi:hypothetical protein